VSRFSQIPGAGNADYTTSKNDNPHSVSTASTKEE